VADDGATREVLLVSEWRILSWSRELGRGAITSTHFARVDFDAAVADVDDFKTGEIVHVDLDPSATPLRVRRIWPDLPRFRARSGAPEIPPLDDNLRIEAEQAIAHANGWTDARLTLVADHVRVELDDDAFAYGASAALDVFDPSYLELPTSFEPRFVQLAAPAARAYLGTRVEISGRDVAVAFTDDERRFYFVVASRVAFTRLRT
jgi:hypothetical protein